MTTYNPPTGILELFEALRPGDIACSRTERCGDRFSELDSDGYTIYDIDIDVPDLDGGASEADDPVYYL